MAEYFSNSTAGDQRPELIIVCAGGHAKVVLDIFEKQGSHNIRGFVDDVKTGEFCGYPILGNIFYLPALVNDNTELFIAIGDNCKRSELAAILSGYKFAIAIHPSAQIGDDIQIDCGTCVMANAVINSGSEIGEFCIVNTGACIDHDNVMEFYSSVGPCVVTGGNVKIGLLSAICIGATVLHGIEIGRRTVIGAGSLVTRNIKSDVVAYGSPCKVIRKRSINEPYL